jgi:hypothetical protein
VAAVEVVASVDLRSRLLLDGDAIVEVPVVPTADVDDARASRRAGSSATLKCVYGSTRTSVLDRGDGSARGTPRKVSS